MMDGARRLFIDLHRHEYKDMQHWMDKQVYLNAGSLLYAASSMGIDAVPLEGIDPVGLDAEFGLRDKGFNALVAISLGYRTDDDFNAGLPKSRLPADELFTRL
ncbi:MAG: nitroreductase family protein, partial [Cobetia crustatorum]